MTEEEEDEAGGVYEVNMDVVVENDERKKGTKPESLKIQRG